jgi:hypothetical protein
MSDAEIPPQRCPTCQGPVDPDAPDTVEGIEQHDVPGFGQAHDYVDGLHAFFHSGCFPDGSPDWRRA